MDRTSATRHCEEGGFPDEAVSKPTWGLLREYPRNDGRTQFIDETDELSRVHDGQGLRARFL
jgi:hypothetical protein